MGAHTAHHSYCNTNCFLILSRHTLKISKISTCRTSSTRVVSHTQENPTHTQHFRRVTVMSGGDKQRDFEIQNAKAALLETGTYDILAKGIRKILDEKPANAASMLGQIFDRVKLEACPAEDNLSSLQACDDKSHELEIAEVQHTLFEPAQANENDVNEDEDEQAMTLLPDMQELAYFFEQGGVGVGREEWLRVYFALKQLCEQQALASCRFWGKVMGLKANYYIAEVSFREEEEEEEDVTEEISPAQVCTSRQITKFFSGDLNASVKSFPEFLGEERHLLRAQIARISHATIVAPMMYYMFDEEEEVDDDELAQAEFIENPDYEGVPVRDLADPSLQAWVHSRLHLLQQGRCLWWNPKQKAEGDEDFDDEDEDAEDDADNEPEQEIGPPLLTSLAEDVELTGLPAWSTHLSSGLMHIQHSICVIRSNLWPGACAFSNGRRFENIYIGYGQKYNTDNYSPPMCNKFEVEYKEPEMVEMADPTVEEENALKAQAEAAHEDDDGGDDEDDDE